MPRNSLPQALIIEPINLSNLQWETQGHNKRKQLNATQYYYKTHERLASQKSFNQKLHYTLQSTWENGRTPKMNLLIIIKQ